MAVRSKKIGRDERFCLFSPVDSRFKTVNLQFGAQQKKSYWRNLAFWNSYYKTFYTSHVWCHVKTRTLKNVTSSLIVDLFLKLEADIFRYQFRCEGETLKLPTL